MLVRVLAVLFFFAPLLATSSMISPGVFPYIYDRSGRALSETEINSPKVDWQLLNSHAHSAYNGVGRFIVPLSDNSWAGCTATFIQTDASGDAPAYALTAGHCVHIDGKSPGYGRIMVDQPVKKMSVKFNFFADARENTRQVSVKRILYASDDRIDVALLELGVSYRRLVKEGFHPFKISSKGASVGEYVEQLSIPQRGIQNANVFLRRSVCQVIERTGIYLSRHISEHEVLHRCSTVGGASGGPLLSMKNHEIVGVVSRSDFYALLEQQLFDDFTRDFPKVEFSTSAFEVAGCFDHFGYFNINLTTCKLEHPCTQTPALNCFEPRCKIGDGRSCFDSALFYLHKSHSPRSLNQGNEFLEKGCDLDDSQSCLALGNQYAFGRGFVQSTDQAFRHFEKACSLKNPRACLNLGIYYRDGVSVAVSLTMAKKYLSQACVAQELHACALLAKIEDDEQTPQAAYLSAQHAAQACIGGSANGCLLLGYAYRDGPVLKVSTERARHFFKLACNLGSQIGCNLL